MKSGVIHIIYSPPWPILISAETYTIIADLCPTYPLFNVDNLVCNNFIMI